MNGKGKRKLTMACNSLVGHLCPSNQPMSLSPPSHRTLVTCHLSFLGALVTWLGLVGLALGLVLVSVQSPMVLLLSPAVLSLLLSIVLPSLQGSPIFFNTGCSHCCNVLCLAVGLLLHLWVLLVAKVVGVGTCKLRVTLV